MAFHSSRIPPHSPELKYVVHMDDYGGRVEHNPLSYTLFYEAKTEEAENYSQIFTCMKIHAQWKAPRS
jgi:hypothetical protein